MQRLNWELFSAREKKGRRGVRESVALEWRHNNNWAEGLNSLCKIKSHNMKWDVE